MRLSAQRLYSTAEKGEHGLLTFMLECQESAQNFSANKLVASAARAPVEARFETMLSVGKHFENETERWFYNNVTHIPPWCEAKMQQCDRMVEVLGWLACNTPCVQARDAGLHEKALVYGKHGKSRFGYGPDLTYTLAFEIKPTTNSILFVRYCEEQGVPLYAHLSGTYLMEVASQYDKDLDRNILCADIINWLKQHPEKFHKNSSFNARALLRVAKRCPEIVDYWGALINKKGSNDDQDGDDNDD